MSDVEIIEIQELKGTGIFKSLSGLLRIIADEKVPIAKKKTSGDTIFVNPVDYRAFKSWKTKVVLTYLGIMPEVKE